MDVKLNPDYPDTDTVLRRPVPPAVDTTVFNYGRSLGAPRGDRRYDNAAAFAAKLRKTSAAISNIAWRLDMAVRQVSICETPEQQKAAVDALITAQADIFAELQKLPGIGLFRFGAIGEWFKTAGMNWGPKIAAIPSDGIAKD